jgi:hypothetical protein
LPALALLILVLVGLRWVASAPPERAARVLRRIGWGLAIGVLLFLVGTGRLSWLFALLGALVPLLQRLLRLLPLLPLVQRLLASRRAARAGRGTAAGQHSDVTTRYLRMSLDHASGVMSGEVIEGPFQGRVLGELSLDELLQLLVECRAADPQSVALLEAYLDRAHGADWRQREAQQGAGAATAAMTPAEAYEVLGLAPGATRAEVIEAHRRLVQKLHPDRGGSSYLAAKINQARDLLLGDRGPA